MAGVYLQTTSNSNYIAPVGVAVFAKLAWADDWTWLPHVYPERVQETVSPSVGQSSFRYDFGNIKRAEDIEFAIWEPYYLEGTYIKVVVYNEYGEEADLWFGVIDVTKIKPHGTTAYPQGQQVFTALELSQMLRRVEIDGTYTEAGWIDRPVSFNESTGFGLSVKGNRSTSADENGVFYFSDDNAEWTAFNTLDYILYRFVNDGNGPDFYLSGETGMLADIVDVWQCEGMNAFDAINRVIDRRRGLGWCIYTAGNADDAIYIYVYSVLDTPITVGDTLLSPNAEQSLIDFTGLRTVDYEITINSLAQYDRVIVKGGPIVSCFSLSYADSTLTEGWTSTEETDYEAGSSATTPTEQEHDSHRQGEQFRNVFQRHDLVADWDGYAGDGEGGATVYNAIPGVDPYTCTIDEDSEPPYWRTGKRFNRELPLPIPGTESDPEPEYRRPFVLAQYTDDDDNAVWGFVDKLRSVEREPANVTMDDSGLRLFVEPTINHVAAENHWAEGAADTGTDPQYDYEDYIATVSMNTDTHLIAMAELLPWRTEKPRVKLIESPQSTAWIIAPNTVIDIEDGELVRQEDVSATWILRDDSTDLLDKLALAVAWYGFPRNTLGYTAKTLSLEHPVGSMIAGIVDPAGYTNIGTIVTSRTWAFSGNKISTSVQTGYQEIDVNRAVK